MTWEHLEMWLETAGGGGVPHSRNTYHIWSPHKNRCLGGLPPLASGKDLPSTQALELYLVMEPTPRPATWH